MAIASCIDLSKDSSRTGSAIRRIDLIPVTFLPRIRWAKRTRARLSALCGATEVATSIATSVAPQSADSLARVRFAHRIRGRKVNGIKSIRRIALPVLEESLERSIQLAIAMESRGYGYFAKPTRYRPERWRLEESALVFALVLLVIVSNLPLSSSAIIAIALFYFLLAPGLFK